ncbi:GIY-YIG nuclease family protein [Chromatium okenii]|uniref:Bacteriophage T5 Orf172 DNA-binding domain-containing protein n=1 Tax=Chromatium okenii TaxID=61644 RepID=A0A2S7XRE3_9GAMM|nr:GIY-YIG nuclease family protein [Chromatium okenii]PQJ96307.1 hypothetical protein CXB77_11215 [Chromatium okenii]
MKGWVYIISNEAMPDFIKVGYSTKDPAERAKELGTGAPYPYQVQYEILVEDPNKIEKTAHSILSFLNEGKEWFRCDVSVAVRAIKKACENKTIHLENYPCKASESSENTTLELKEFDPPHVSKKITPAVPRFAEQHSLNILNKNDKCQSDPKNWSTTPVEYVINKTEQNRSAFIDALNKVLLACEGRTVVTDNNMFWYTSRENTLFVDGMFKTAPIARHSLKEDWFIITLKGFKDICAEHNIDIIWFKKELNRNGLMLSKAQLRLDSRERMCLFRGTSLRERNVQMRVIGINMAEKSRHTETQQPTQGNADLFGE